MAQSIQSLIAASVNGLLREFYPDNYCSLCHAHAIVGANLISVVLGRVYRPVAGLALIDCGAGTFFNLTDNAAFANPAGGAFHCWIESVDESFREKEVVDFTFRHNRDYAIKNGMQWRREEPPAFLWGPASKVVIQAEPENMPPSFPQGMLWLRETDEGWDWITQHMAQNMNAYVTLTSEALKLLQSQLPPGSPVLAPALTPRPAATSAATAGAGASALTPGSAPASVPTPA
ncbi:MAG: hypothetical protein V4582_20835 [Pseudomonadota bacterium]